MSLWSRPLSVVDKTKYYSLDFQNRDNYYMANPYSLDTKVVGTVKIDGSAPPESLVLEDGAFLQFAGESQRDECLGNLDFCTLGNQE